MQHARHMLPNTGLRQIESALHVEVKIPIHRPLDLPRQIDEDRAAAQEPVE